LGCASLQPNTNCIIKDNTDKILILDRISEINFENSNKTVPRKKPVLYINSFYQQQRTDHPNIGEAIK